MMKRSLLPVLFVLLLIQGNAYAEILDLGNDVKINIPNNYEYCRLHYGAYKALNIKYLEISEKEIEDAKKNDRRQGLSGAEKITFIGKKGIAKGLCSYLKHSIEGKNIKTWEGFYRINKACDKSKGSLILTRKCVRKENFSDPTFTIVMADETSTEMKKISKFFDLPPNKNEKKEIEEFKKSSGNDFDRYITERTGAKQKHREKKSLVILGDKWFFETKGKLVIDGEKSKTHVLMTLLNDHVIFITSQCYSRKTCKNIDQLMLKIIGPTFSLEITKIKKFDTSNKKEMIKMFNTVKNGYRYYKLAKFLIILL